MLLTIVSSISAYCQETDEVVIYYRLNEARIDSCYMSNGENLQKIREFLKDKGNRLESISICALSSPEGPLQGNGRLAQKRARALEDYLDEVLSESGSAPQIHTSVVAENWYGLKESVMSGYHRHDREKVLSILNDTGISDETRKWRLRQLDNGYTWSHLIRNLMPLLRQAAIIRVTYRPVVPMETKGPALLSATSPLSGSVLKPVVRIPAPDEDVPMSGPEERKFTFAVKTNLLHDAVLVPDIGLEFCLGNKWSLGADWNCAWWDNDGRHRYWRVYGGTVELRRYFGPKARERALSGHHIGVYGLAGTYDFELGDRGQLSDLTYGAGISYGYSLPIAKAFNIDFSLGIGYAGGEYKTYDPKDGCYVWKETRNRNWFGPSKAEISLVWLIGGHGKGGGR